MGFSTQLSSTSLENDYRGFSCPFEPIQEELVPFIVQEHARGISRSFVEKLGENVRHKNRKILEVIEPWLQGQNIMGSGWDNCFGDIYNRIHFGSVDDQMAVITAIAMHLGSLGIKGSWQAEFTSSFRFRWGNLLLPLATGLSIETDGRTACIKTNLGKGPQSVFYIFKNGFQWIGHGLDVLPVITNYRTCITILPKASLTLPGFRDVVDTAVPIIDRKMIKVLEDSLDIINKYTPKYIPWVRRTVKNIFLIILEDHTMYSGSIEIYLGLAHFSANSKPLPIAELLIHEAAHQHMNILTKLGPVYDGSDKNTYYSPPVKKHRRIPLILAAYHAFANVLIFYRLCRDMGMTDRKECDRQESLLLPWLSQLEKPLIDNPALTPLGNSLWQPLQKILQ